MHDIVRGITRGLPASCGIAAASILACSSCVCKLGIRVRIRIPDSVHDLLFLCRLRVRVRIRVPDSVHDAQFPLVA